jgi:disulfide bond formation protein DsbB
MNVKLHEIGKDDAGNTRWTYFVWIVSLVATSGSLFFSEVMKLPPCVLCWYQRIAMYPIAVLLPIAILKGQTHIVRSYILPLVLIGLVISAYHNLLYYELIRESIVPCSEGISCTSRQIEWLGFITIPLLSLVSFLLIGFGILCGYFGRISK